MPIPSFSVYQDTWQGNQLQYSTPRTNNITDTDLSTWGVGGAGAPTITTGQSDPSGGTGAAKIVFGSTSAGYFYQYITANNPQSYGIWLKGAVGGEVVAWGGNYGGANAVTLTTAWAYYQANNKTTLDPACQIYSNTTITIYAFAPMAQPTTAVTGDFIPTAGSPVTVTDYSYNVGGTQIVFATAPILGSIITGVYENGGHIFSIGTGDGTTTDFDVPTSNTIELAVPQNIYSNGSPYHAFSITPSDTAMLAACTLKIYAGGTGAISVILNRDDIDHPFTFQAVAHTFYDIAASQVLATGTTATGIIGLN